MARPVARGRWEDLGVLYMEVRSIFGTESIVATWAPRVLSVLRIVAALLMLQHGLSKYVGFPAPGPSGFHVFGLLGIAGAIEVIASLLLVVGRFTRPAAFILSGQMAVAYFMAHASRSFFPMVNGGELSVLYCFVFLYIAFAGGGAWSLDAMRRRSGRG